MHNTFLGAYRDQDWDRAGTLAKALETQGLSHDLHHYYKIMGARIERFSVSPPPSDWGGIYKATEK